MVCRQLLKACRGFARERESVSTPCRGDPFRGFGRYRLSGARIRAHLAPFLNLTKPKQRGLDRKRVSRHICIVKALGNMSLYYLRALPCICSDLPLAIASHPERAHFCDGLGRQTKQQYPSIAMRMSRKARKRRLSGRVPFCFDLVTCFGHLRLSKLPRTRV